MKHHSQVFIALFLFILLIHIFPLQEGYTNKQTRMSDIFSDNSGNLDDIDNSGNVNTDIYNNKWVDIDKEESSKVFKFSDNYNYKFANPMGDIEISKNTITKPDFKFYSRYWPISDN